MNNDQNPMNETTSSWTTENMNNDVNRYYTNKNKFNKQPINQGIFGEKYILNNENAKFFEKYDTSLSSNEDYKNYITGDLDKISLSSQALNSAFVSCFSHTPYPVGIKYIDKKPFVVWRFDEKDESVKDFESKHKENIYGADFRKMFFYRDVLGNIKDDLNQAIKNENINKAIIQLNVQQVFFAMFDRKYDNIVIKNDRLSHLDATDENAIKENYSFLYNGREDLGTLLRYIELLDDYIIKNQENIKIVQNQIKKIQNIDYNLFVERYIRNCLVLGIKEEEALECLTKFVRNMVKFAKDRDIMQKYRMLQEFGTLSANDNKYCNLLNEGYEQYLQNLQNNQTLKNISNGNYKDTFYQLFKKCKTKYVYTENQKQVSAQQQTSDDKSKNIKRDKISAFEQEELNAYWNEKLNAYWNNFRNNLKPRKKTKYSKARSNNNTRKR